MLSRPCRKRRPSVREDGGVSGEQKFFLSLFSAVLGLCCHTGFSLVAASGGFSLVAVCEFLIAVTSLVVEQGLEVRQTG